jgi:uncharacterized membrane protein
MGMWKLTTAICLVLLALVYLTDHLIINLNPLSALVRALPLLLFLHPLFKENYRAAQWLGFILPVYFIDAVLAVFTPEHLMSGSLALVFCVLSFISAILFIRQGIRRPVKE